MTTNFPASLDSLTNPVAGDSLASPSHADQHANANDAIEALQAKVGVDGSAVTTSLDYKVAQAVTLTGTQTLTNKTLTSPVLTMPKERWESVFTAPTGTVNFDALTAGVRFYQLDATGNWTVNVRGDSGTSLNSVMANGDAITIALIINQGSTAYRATTFAVDGVPITPLWQNAAPTAGNANAYDVYVYTILKNSFASFSALASMTKFVV